MASPSLISRLYKDLAELHESPYPGVAIFIDDSNLRKFCLVLTPPSGPWKNLSLHFDVVLPEDWPTSPPQVSSSVDGIDHPNLFGSYVCCDLLKTKEHIYRGGGYTGGYSPALTLRGLFLQFLTFFSSTKIDQDYGYTIDVGDSAIVHYVMQLDPQHLAGHKGMHRCATCDRRSSSGQLDLQQQWEQNTNPATVLHEYDTEIGPLFETVKSSGPGTRIHRIEERNYRWDATYDSIRYWRCRYCPYGTDAVPHCVGPNPQIVMEQAHYNLDESSSLFMPQATCHLDQLNDDVLYEIALRLPSESLLNFSVAYPRLHNIVQSMHILLQRELRCFFLRTPLPESILGIGVALDFRSRNLSSDFDWLSQRAFVEFGVRESVEKREFGFFLPLAFSRAHFERAYPHIWSRLAELDAAVQKAENQMSRNPRRRAPGPAQRRELVGVVYRMMNNIVVSLMKSCDTVLNSGNSSKTLLHASEKAVVAYCHLFHLLICLCRSESKILLDATNRLRRFIDRKDTRVKTHVPDLGELIILIMLVLCRPPVGGGPPIKWSDLAGPFLEEVIVRNVRWVLKDAPHLEIMEQGASDYRLAETFLRSQTSLRLVSFQITFLDVFIKAYGADISRLDDNYGFPEKELPVLMVEKVKDIYKIDTWPAFFARVRFARGVGFGKERFSDMLRDAMKTSATRRYHYPAPVSRLPALRAQKKAAEEAFAEPK
ncbi:ubiquitin-CONJUGAT-2 domain-containing protein [Favolaschia claudopus]|uniref:Ubiquitin-CONJUGAT-2 domain-containing protein n=1 Tax=Favolaschia claudopus TaxID=2862362 RepID=A0AAW0DC26_9AGAR